MSEKLRVSELTELVETQREQLRRYECRFRDLVRAYKSLQKEKEALEASVKALSVVQEEDGEELVAESEEPAKGREEHDDASPTSSTASPIVPISSPSSSDPPSADPSVQPPPVTPPLPHPSPVRPVLSDVEDVASSIDAASASEAEKTDSEDAADERFHPSSTPPRQQQQPCQQQQQQQHLQRQQRLKSQVATLSNALAAITSEKNKMESSFQADKKRAKEEKEEMTAALAAEKNAREAEVNAVKTQTNELKSKLRSEQLERDQEQTDHVVMLSELQTLLTQQKRLRETLEQQLDEEKTERKKLQTALQAQEAMAAFASRPGVKPEEEKPKSAPTINVDNHPAVVKMKKDFQESKTQLNRALQQERSRAREAEEHIVRTRLASEEVVRSLEDRITELSSTVGTYERLRVQDQRSLETLKEELEKRLLAADSATMTPSTSSALGTGRPRERLPPIGANQGEEDDASLKFVMNDELSSDPRYLLSKMKDLKTKMQVVLTSPLFEGEDIPSCEIADVLFDKIELSDLHASCRQESRDLESEVTRLAEQLNVVTQRAKAESPVKISIDENESLKLRIMELEKEVIFCQEDLLSKERKMRKEAEETNERIFRAEKKEEETRREEEDKWRDKLDEVVKEMKKQRDRTMSLLQQKEAEVEAARNDAVEMVASSRERTISRQGSSHRSRHDSFVSEDRRSPSVEPGFTRVHEDLGGGRQLESALSTDDVGNGSGLPLGGATLHVACREALSRVQADLRLTRKQKADVETALRKIQNGLALTEESHRSEVDKLSRDVERLLRNEQRASELGSEKNLEYLKNVVYKLIISRDSASKLQLIPVVATILQFTADEKQKALAKYQSWWVTPSSSSSSSYSATSIATNNGQA